MKSIIHTCALLAVKLSALFFIALVASAAEFDDAMPAQPAVLTDKRSSLQNRIRFPDLNGEIFVLLLCSGSLKDNGRFTGEVNCFRDKEIEDSLRPFRTRTVSTYDGAEDLEIIDVTVDRGAVLEEQFEREVILAAGSARIQPAKINGRKVPVKLNFSVKFEKSANEEGRVEVFMHNFRNQSLLGTDYIAAQRFTGKQGLFEVAAINQCPELFIPVWIRSIVMSNGSAYNISEFNMDESEIQEGLERCVTAYKVKMKESIFIPTVAHGSYVNAFYTELFYDNPNRDNDVDFEAEYFEKLMELSPNRNISSMSDDLDPIRRGEYHKEYLEVKGIIEGPKNDYAETARCTLNPYILADPFINIPECRTQLERGPFREKKDPFSMPTYEKPYDPFSPKILE